MKKLFTIFSSLFALIISFPFMSVAVNSLKQDSVVLGASYVNDVYYNFSSGAVKSTPRAAWDIAFRTRKLSSSILTNDGSGVVLYTYPKADTSGWNNVDTAGLASWTPMYNDPTDWENGAFSRNQKGQLDYGWGVYNMSTHNLTGDSLFIIKLRDKSLRKLWIMTKKSAADIYIFKYANIDGSGLNQVTLDLSTHQSPDFYGYSIQTNEEVDFQPSRTSWDLLFTKYMSVQPNGTPYLVVGVLNNDSVSSKKFYPVPLTYDDFGAGIWDSTRSAIGYDWKKFDMNSFTYVIIDSTVYFVQQITGDKYKLIFTAFTGSGSGIVRFNTQKAAGAGINSNSLISRSLNVYPNPAKDKINIELPENQYTNLFITLTDLSGRQLRADSPKVMANKPFIYTMDVTGVQPGIYLVNVMSAATSWTTKVIITE